MHLVQGGSMAYSILSILALDLKQFRSYKAASTPRRSKGLKRLAFTPSLAFRKKVKWSRTLP